MKDKNMYKHKIFNCILIILLFGIIGCDDDKKSIYETGPKVVSLALEDGETTKEVIVDPAKTGSFLLQAKLDQPSAFGVVAQAEVKLELVDAYNEKHGTNYEKINPTSYNFVRSEFVFPKYTELSSQIEFSFNALNMATDVFYLLPVQITEVRGDENVSIDEEANIIYLIVSKLPPPPLVHLKDVELTTEIGPGKKNWFAAYTTNSEGGHTFSVEEAAEQSMFMDFALVKHGSNVRIHPSIIGWQHKGDYQKHISAYIVGFEKLTHVCNLNMLFTPELFDSVNSSEEMAAKIAELKISDPYDYYGTDRMTSHNLQSQITGNNRVLIIAWGSKIKKNEQFALLHIKEVTALDAKKIHYKVKFDIKYVDSDMKTAAENTSGQNVIVKNPAYKDAIKEYKGVELTTEIGPGKKNWFSAYADKDMVAFTQEEAKNKSSMMDFVPVLHAADNVALYSPYIGQEHGGAYQTRIAPYVQGFAKIPYTMIGGQRAGNLDATKAEHYDFISDMSTLNGVVGQYLANGYDYTTTDRMMTDKLTIGSVVVFGWGVKPDDKPESKIRNNNFGILIVRDIQPTTGGNYKLVLDIKVPETDCRTPNNDSAVDNPNL